MKLKSLLNETAEDVELVIRKENIDAGSLVSDYSKRICYDVSVSMSGGLKLENLKNFPYKITGKLKVYDCHHLTTLEGSVMDVEVLTCIRSHNLLSLEGIGRRYIKRMVSFFPSISIKTNILGLVLVKDLVRIDTLGYTNEPLEDAFGIILFEALENESDILNCKEKLISNGYKDLAKL